MNMRGIPQYTLVWGARYTLGARYLSKNMVVGFLYNIVEVYLYSQSGPTWPVLGSTLNITCFTYFIFKKQIRPFTTLRCVDC